MSKFTQETKDMWLNALKSGNYKQGYCFLSYPSNDGRRHCCIGVLGDIHPELDNDVLEGHDENPYTFLGKHIGNELLHHIYSINDLMIHESEIRPKDYGDDYSNVIPIIENLPIEE